MVNWNTIWNVAIIANGLTTGYLCQQFGLKPLLLFPSIVLIVLAYHYKK